MSALVLVAVSVVAPPQPAAVPQAPAVTAPAGSGFDRPPPDKTPRAPATETRPSKDRASRVAPPEASPTPPLADTSPAARPQTGPAQPEVAPAPGAEGAAPRVASAPEPTIPQGLEAVPPTAPATEPTPGSVSQPPASPAPDSGAAAPAPQTPAAGQPPAAASGAGVTAAVGDAPVTEGAAAAAPRQPATAQAPQAGTDSAPVVASTAPETAAPAPAPDADAAPQSPAPASQPTQAGQPAAPQAPVSDAAPKTLPQEGAKIPTRLPMDTGMPKAPGAPSPGFQTQMPGVKVGRLPGTRVGTLPGTGSVAADKTANAAAGTGAGTGDDTGAATPPLKRNAVGFDNPQGRPVFSVILIDDGASGVDRQGLAALNLPITFAIDPTLPGAGRMAAIYHRGGHEVLMLAPTFDPAANRTTLSAAFAAYRSAMPQAVGLLDRARGGFEDNHSLSEEVVSVLAKDGLGLVTYARGLNAANQIASGRGLAAARIYRQLDATGETPEKIRRYLDRAAFRATQEGRVVVVGHIDPATLRGLKLWAGDARAQTVALAPITAAMRP